MTLARSGSCRTWTSSRTAGGTTTHGPATRCSPRPTRKWAPWHVVRTDDKKRGRLNLITHLLSQIPYEPLQPKKVKFPARQKPGDYTEPDLWLASDPDPVLTWCTMTG